MTDLEINKLCAEAMGYELNLDAPVHHDGTMWNPLRYDAQAMALEDWLIEHGAILTYGLSLGGNQRVMWFLPVGQDGGAWMWFIKDKQARRRAICLCVAKMQQNINLCE